MNILEKGMITDDYSIILPEAQSQTLGQDEEYCILKSSNGAGEQRIRFHDYRKIYSIPRLYERLFYKKLKCTSPSTICGYLKEVVDNNDTEFSNMRVLDLGAGNGMVGEELNKIGVEQVCGIDIEENAKKAVERDRPDIYKKYLIEDITNMSVSLTKELESESFNCMTTVAALGFGDIPPEAFVKGFNLLSTPAWVAFNIKENFISDCDSSGFSILIKKMIDEEVLDIQVQERYQHRLSIEGNPLYYVALVGRKLSNVPEDWIL
ncbi:MAG: class I SAM-dependent methyltransferase [Nitrospirota bacterium]